MKTEERPPARPEEREGLPGLTPYWLGWYAFLLAEAAALLASFYYFSQTYA